MTTLLDSAVRFTPQHARPLSCRLSRIRPVTCHLSKDSPSRKLSFTQISHQQALLHQSLHTTTLVSSSSPSSANLFVISSLTTFVAVGTDDFCTDRLTSVLVHAALAGGDKVLWCTEHPSLSRPLVNRHVLREVEADEEDTMGHAESSRAQGRPHPSIRRRPVSSTEGLRGPQGPDWRRRLHKG